MSKRRERTAYWGTCVDCLTTVIVAPHPDRPHDLPNYDDWERSFPDCPVCDASLSWDGIDPVEDVLK